MIFVVFLQSYNKLLDVNRTYKYPCVILPDNLYNIYRSTFPYPELDVDFSEDMKLKKYGNTHIGTVGVIVSFLIFIISYYADVLWATFFAALVFGFFVAYSIIENEENEKREYLDSLNGRMYAKMYAAKEEYRKKYEETIQLNSDFSKLCKFRREKMKEVLLHTDSETFPSENKCAVLYEKFHEELSKRFDGVLYYNRYVKDRLSDMRFAPDYMLVFGDSNLCVAIEIDKPYSLEEREPEDYISAADNGLWESFGLSEDVFCGKGWIVVRFSEPQVVSEPLKCCKKIVDVITGIIGSSRFTDGLENVGVLESQNFWTLEQCRYYAQNNFRESYLGLSAETETVPVEDMTENNVKDEKVNKVIEKDESEEEVKNADVKEENVEKVEDVKEEDVKKEEDDIKKDDLKETDEEDAEKENAKDEVKEKENIEEDVKKEEEKEEDKEEVSVIEEEKSADIEIMTPLYNKISEYYGLENWDKLIECCDMVLEREPDSSLAYLRRGTAKGNLGRLNEAASDFEKAVSAAPENADAWYNLGVVNLMLKKNLAAIDCLKRAAGAGIEDKSGVYQTIADIYNELSDGKNYLEYLQKASEAKNKTVKDVVVGVKENVRAENTRAIDMENVFVKSQYVFRDAVSEAVFSRNDKFLAVSSPERNLKIYTPELDLVFEGSYPAVAAVFGAKYLALSGHGVLKVFNVTDGFGLHSDFSMPQISVKKMFFHPENDGLLFVSDNYQVWTVDVNDGSIVKVMKDFKLMSVSSSCAYVVGKDYFNNLKVFAVDSLREISSLKLEPGVHLKTAAVDAVCSKVITGDKSGRLRVFSVPDMSVVFDTGLQSEVMQIETGDGSFFSVLTGDRRLRLFDMQTFKRGREYRFANLPKIIKTGNHSNILAVCGFDGSLKIAQLEYSAV